MMGQAVLECIRDLMNTDIVVPEWLHDVLLGYGDPARTHYSQAHPPSIPPRPHPLLPGTPSIHHSPPAPTTPRHALHPSLPARTHYSQAHPLSIPPSPHPISSSTSF